MLFNIALSGPRPTPKPCNFRASAPISQVVGWGWNFYKESSEGFAQQRRFQPSLVRFPVSERILERRRRYDTRLIVPARALGQDGRSATYQTIENLKEKI